MFVDHICSSCKTSKPPSEFRLRMGKPSHTCKLCHRAWRKQNDILHKETILSQQRNRYWHHGRRKKSIKYCRKYYYLNREKLIIYAKKARQTEQYKLRERVRNKKRNQDVYFRLQCKLRNRVYAALKGINQSIRTQQLLGCSLQKFKNYIESLFQPGMAWENYTMRGWHIDHIIPCSSFDLTDPQQQLKCFHWSNLQPLWAKDNMSKGDKMQVGGEIIHGRILRKKLTN